MTKKASKKKTTKKATTETGRVAKPDQETKPSALKIIKGSPVVKRDKEFQTLLPPLPAEVRDALEGSIKNEGLREPLLVWKVNGELVLVDGYNRLKFCMKHGREYQVILKSFNDREEVKEWMWKNQESRRNMTPYQRIEVVLKFKGIIEEQAKQKQRKGKCKGNGMGCEIVNNPTDDEPKVSKTKFEQIRTNEILGKRAGVSYATVGKVRDIQKKIADGVISREELGELREGKVSINKIYNLYKDKKEKQLSKRNITERSSSIIRLLKMQVARSFQQAEDCTSLYDRIIEWANARKAGLEEPSE